MKNLKRSRPTSLILILLWPGALHAIAARGGDYDLSKCLIGASGVNQVISPDYSAAYALGEDVAGTQSTSSDYDFVSGYFSAYASGHVGAFSLLSATVGPTKILQDGFQVGVPLGATVQLAFSSPLDPTTLTGGIQVSLLMDHFGQSQNGIVPSTYTYEVTGTTVVISAQEGWLGNTLYDVVANTDLRSIDGFSLGQDAHTPFITVLDPHEENVVLHPIPLSAAVAVSGTGAGPTLHLDIPKESLSDYSFILVSKDPIHSPLRVDPTIVQAATQKGQISGGAYQTPLAIQEIAAFNQQGQPVHGLSNTIRLSISYSGAQGFVSGTGLPIRPGTLSLWTLDSVHQLWVKIPASRPDGANVSAPVTQFSTYALMGAPDGSASDVFLFPIPWRPHGPGAGTGSGQTGTDTGGLTFSNLPSECTIKIYTLAGELVRELRHSDLTGPLAQEKWDGNTSGGDHAASGVYLWRVESSVDGKNGKLMLIR